MGITGSTVMECFDRTVIARPDQTFLVCGRRTISFAQAAQHVSSLATMLAEAGAARGTRIAFQMPNIAEFPLLLLACWRLGALPIPINQRYTVGETADLLRRSRAQVFVCSASSAWATAGGTAALPDLRRTIIVDDAEDATDVAVAAASRHATNANVVDANVHEAAVVVYTSGTSGAPKGAVLPHGLIRNCLNIICAMRITGDDRILGHMPLNHVAGLLAALMPAVISGATLVLVRRWEAAAVADLIEAQRVSVFGGIPTHFVDLLEAVREGRQDMSSLRMAWIGGAAISPDLAQRAKADLGLESLQAIYGMTETTSTTTLSAYDDDVSVVCENRGLPIGSFEVAIFDTTTGEQADQDTVGEVRVRGHIVMLGYLDDPAATAEAIDADGWFHTGDLGRVDAGGYLQITGRLKDVFRVGGSTVSPAEVERVIEAVEGVSHAIVVGAPDARLGEIGVAFVASKSHVSAAAIDAACRAQLAGYKRPRVIEFLTDLPMTSTGKVQRQVLRERARQIVDERHAADAAA